PEAELVQPGARSDHHTEAARSNFDVKLPFITLFDPVEAGRIIRNEPRQDVEASRRALRIRESGNVAPEIDVFQQGNDIYTALFQDGAVADVDPEALEARIQLAHLFEHQRSLPGQEAGIDGVGILAEAQVYACRLDLVGKDLGLFEDADRGDLTGAQHLPDFLARQDPRVGGRSSGFLRCGQVSTFFDDDLREHAAAVAPTECESCRRPARHLQIRACAR